MFPLHVLAFPGELPAGYTGKYLYILYNIELLLVAFESSTNALPSVSVRVH